ncbi:MAG: PepSY domain-containing protein [Clostridia bacterium]
MRNKEINRRLNRAVNEAPINLLDDIKNQPIKKIHNHSHITRQEDKKKRSFKPIYALASISLVFIFIFVLLYQSSAIASQIYLDINPGIEISLNKSDKVVDIEADNMDERILNSLDYQGKDLYKVMGKLLDELKVNGYINKDKNAILLSIESQNVDKKRVQMEQLNELIHEYFIDNDLSLVLLRQEIQEDDEMNETNVSKGKRTFVKNLVQLEPDLESEELMEMSLEELIKLSQEISLDLKSIVESDEKVYDYYDKEPSMTSYEEAIAIAFELTKGGVVIEIELDEDDEQLAYEIDILNGNKEFELLIDAYSGNVLEYEEEYDDDIDDEDETAGNTDINNSILDINEISKIALRHTGSGVITEINLEEDDGMYVYEVKVETQTGEYEIEIDAASGKIIKIETENEYDDIKENIDEDIISKGEAIEIARGIGGSGEIEIELEQDDERYIYEVEVKTQAGEYEIEINAVTGEIEKYDHDEDDEDDEDDEIHIDEELADNIISLEQAKGIALSLTDKGVVIEVDLEEDNGLLIYQIEIEDGETEYEIELDAFLGEIISFEKD